MITNLLRANAASCLGFGALFLALPGPVAGFLGTPPVWLVAAGALVPPGTELESGWLYVGSPAKAHRELTDVETAIRDVVNVLKELFGAQAEGVDREAIADELFLEGHGLTHHLGQLLAEVSRPYVLILLHKVHQEVAEQLDVVGLVAQGVAEHLADAGELVLAVEREHHPEQPVELRALHALPEQEHVLGEGLLILQCGQVEVAPELFEFVLDGLGRFFLAGGEHETKNKGRYND